MRIEFFSDMICPFCYIGKRRLNAALGSVDHRDQADVVYRSFQLDPDAAPVASETLPEREMRVHGLSPQAARSRLASVTAMAAAEGLDYHLDRALPVRTFDAHRLLHHAARRGLAAAVAENLLRAYAVEGRSIADHHTLAELAADAGIDHARALSVLESDDHTHDVLADLARARSFGITGVPSLVVDETYIIPGVATTATIIETLRGYSSRTRR